MSAPHNKPRRSWSERERELLDQLEEMFLADGFAHLTVADLARSLSCSKSTIYRLAPSKDALVALVIDRVLDRVNHQARSEASARTDPVAKLSSFLEVGVDRIRPGRPAFTRDVEGRQAARDSLDRHLRTGITDVQELIDEGIAEGIFRPVPTFVVAHVLEGAFTPLRQPAVLAEAGLTQAEASDVLVQLLIRGLVRRTD